MAGWWKRIKKEATPSRELAIPKIDAEKINQLKFVGIARPLSDEDRTTLASLKSELISSGFLDREEAVTIEEPDDIESAFEIAGEQGNHNIDQMTTYDKELDEHISSSGGGENYLLDEFDDEEDIMYDDVYTDNQESSRLEVRKIEGAVELKLPDGSVIMGHIPGR